MTKNKIVTIAELDERIAKGEKYVAKDEKEHNLYVAVADLQKTLIAWKADKFAMLEEIDKYPINEICQCGHSKDCHGISILDNHGKDCNQCACREYTWKSFIFLEGLKQSLGGGQ
jgi:hypothetical protein